MLIGGGALVYAECAAQTPEQQQLWNAQRAQSLADQQLRAQQLEHDRAARKADPMGWARTLNPMSSGGWEFRAVASDGSWAAYSTSHQMKRSGKTVVMWLREEYAEPQQGTNGPYLSLVEKAQYDCAKEQERALILVYYSANNIQGSEETEEADIKTAPWNAIVPGTRAETNFLWACNLSKRTAGN